MPPAANDSQGLKIAVAAFVTLTVVLAVTTYFGFSNYSEASAQLEQARSAENQAKQAQAKLQNAVNDLKERMGYTKEEEAAAVLASVQKDHQALIDSLNNLNNQIKARVQDYQAKGGNSQAVAELSAAGDQLVRQIAEEVPTSFQSTLSRMNELLQNRALLITELTIDYGDVNRDLVAANEVAQRQIDIAEKGRSDAETQLRQEITAHETQRSNLLTSVKQYQDQLATKQNQIDTLNAQIAELTARTAREKGELQSVMKGLKEEQQLKETVLDIPDGRIVTVDLRNDLVRTDVGRSQGAREQMQFAIFDRNAPGLPTDQPKGTIQLVRVGSTSSMGKILTQTDDTNPITQGDIIYSPAWSPNSPKKFALLGKIDVDRDGEDDRNDLIRIIRSAGGEVVYDLPPPGVGHERGRLAADTYRYILDQRTSYRHVESTDLALNDKDYLAALTRARDFFDQNGVRPMAIETLLAQLGWEYGTPAPGTIERVNRRAVEALTAPPTAPRELAPTDEDTLDDGFDTMDDDGGF